MSSKPSGETEPGQSPRCPRCGGAAAPARRSAIDLNPFLAADPHLTCEDCGLDFPTGAVAPAPRGSVPPW